MNVNDIIPGYTIFDRIEIHDIPRRGIIYQPGVTPPGKNGKPKIHITLKGQNKMTFVFLLCHPSGFMHVVVYFVCQGVPLN
jgi:hypothetical protein